MSKMYPCKESISENEKLQLIGLLTLAKRHNAALNSIRDAVIEITGEKDDSGHGSDAVFCDYEVEALLDKLEIKVVTPDTSPKARELP